MKKFLILTVSIFLYFESWLFSEIKYEIITIPTLDSYESSTVIDINDNGFVIGSLSKDNKNIGFIWRKDQNMMLIKHSFFLNLINNYNIYLTSVNNSNEIVGYSIQEISTNLYGKPKAFKWSPDKGLADLKFNFETERIIPDSINNNGEMAGIYELAHESQSTMYYLQHSFLLNKSNELKEITEAMTDGRKGKWGRGSAINDFGFVTGFYSDPDSFRGQKAFLWSGEQFLDLGSLQTNEDYIESIGIAINNSNCVVGESRVNLKNDIGSQAFLWTPEQGMIGLGYLNKDPNSKFGRNSKANDINDRMEVVGEAHTAKELNTHAFIWNEMNGMQDLNDLIDPSLGWNRLQSATAINNNGEIAGIGYYKEKRRGFLLIPVDQ